MNSRSIRLVAYLRVSSSQQATDGTIGVQRHELRAWAKANGHQIVGWAEDEGISGSKEHFDRPGLAAALNTIEGGQADGIVFTKLDRLARDLIVQEATLRLLHKAGAQVFSVHDQMMLDDDAATPEAMYRKAMRQVMGVFSDLERGMTRWRMEQGRKVKAEHGGYCGGAPPFGFTPTGGELVENPREAAVVDRIVQLRGQGRSYRQIARVLAAEGVRSKKDASWQPMTVKRIYDRAQAA